MTSREVLAFDVVIVGGGPAGLSTAIRLAQLAQAQQRAYNICLVDKGESIGAHILSGAVLDPRALNELIPDWQKLNPPTHTAVQHDKFLFLTQKKAWCLPTPPPMKNHGNFIISLDQFCRFLANQAEQLGVNIFPGFAVTDYREENNQIVGVITGDKGIDVQGKPKADYQPGIELRAKQIILAEGCRGSLSKKIIARYQLNAAANPQTYGLGLKEVWEIPTAQHRAGEVWHTIGWPLTYDTYGGGFLYQWSENLVSLGFVVGLDYQNPYLNPYEELQRFKLHPHIRPLLANGKRIAYGARTLVEGGIQSLPKLTFPGGVIIGDAAGFLNVAKIKGIHNAMKSGMLAAENINAMLLASEPPAECISYPKQVKQSWLWSDLYRVRNIRPAFKWGLIPALIYAGIDTYLFRGYAPWTLQHRRADHLMLKPAQKCQPIAYPKHDNQVTFDLMSSVYLANIKYEENQPYHLKLANRQQVPIEVNFQQYAAPETRYCPAGVYEIVYRGEPPAPRLQINGGNCLHCKACDIKDPTQNITWTPSEGGSGPDYTVM